MEKAPDSLFGLFLIQIRCSRYPYQNKYQSGETSVRSLKVFLGFNGSSSSVLDSPFYNLELDSLR
jgi:hypothetical protein